MYGAGGGDGMSPMKIVISLNEEREPISGSIDAGGTITQFVGWMDLLQALDGLLRA
jgi:hypothetical protein